MSVVLFGILINFFDKDSVFLTVEYPKNEEELRNLLAKY
jgi:hypothetical protein